MPKRAPQLTREEKAHRRLFGGSHPNPRKPKPVSPVLSPHAYPQYVLSLTGPRGNAQITLHRKHGVWFIVNASGSLRLNDFAAANGWGDTRYAIDRCARHLNYAISNPLPPPAPVTETPHR